MNTLKQFAAIAALSLALAPGIQAVPLPMLQGEISFQGDLQIKNGGTNSTLFGTHNFAEFVNPWTVTYVSGDYVGLVSLGDAVTFSVPGLTTVAGTYGPSAPLPYTNFWSIQSGAFTFDLESYSVVRTVNGIRKVDWTGTGTANGTGFDPNGFATWAMGISSASPTQGVFSLTSQFTSAPAVPDGGNVVFLMGCAILGLAGVRRFRVRA